MGTWGCHAEAVTFWNVHGEAERGLSSDREMKPKREDKQRCRSLYHKKRKEGDGEPVPWIPVPGPCCIPVLIPAYL